MPVTNQDVKITQLTERLQQLVTAAKEVSNAVGKIYAGASDVDLTANLREAITAAEKVLAPTPIAIAVYETASRKFRAYVIENANKDAYGETRQTAINNLRTRYNIAEFIVRNSLSQPTTTD